MRFVDPHVWPWFPNRKWDRLCPDKRPTAKEAPPLSRAERQELKDLHYGGAVRGLAPWATPEQSERTQVLEQKIILNRIRINWKIYKRAEKLARQHTEIHKQLKLLGKKYRFEWP